MKISMLSTCIAVSLSTCLVGCGGGNGDGNTGNGVNTGNNGITQDVNINFKALAGDKALACDDTFITGVNQTNSKLADIHFYVSNLKLIKSDGSAEPVTLNSDNKWYYNDGKGNNVAMIDLENNYGSCNANGNDKDINSVITGKVAQGNYIGISYDIGVPDSLNHLDITKSPAPLDHTGLAWSWQSGKKFLKIEVKPEGGVVYDVKNADGTVSTATATTFMMHLGSTGCSGDPAKGETATCTYKNIMPVKLTNFNPTTQSIGVDVAGLFKNSDIKRNNGGAMGCMSALTDPECPAIFNTLGLDLNTGLPALNANQTLFKVVAN